MIQYNCRAEMQDPRFGISLRPEGGIEPLHTRTAWQAGSTISITAVGELKNGFTKWVIHSIYKEAIDLSEYHNYDDGNRLHGYLLDDVYTHKRLHSPFCYLTPAEQENQWLTQQAVALVVGILHMSILCPILEHNTRSSILHQGRRS